MLAIVLASTACSLPRLPVARLSDAPADSPAVPAPSATPTPVAPEPLEVREFWPLDERYDDYLMPDVVGMPLDEAKTLLDKWDPYLKEEDASGDGRRAWADGNWTVVSQHPLPGAPQTSGRGVDLGILKHEEVGDSLDDLPAEDRHVYDRVFTGTVTAHGEYPRQLFVDGAELQLDLVAPIAEGCGIEYIDGTDSAYAAQLATIPLGARVLVVRSEQGDDRAFVHVLVDDQLVAEPPLESANEALVRTGWWAPESNPFDGGFSENLDQSVSFDVWSTDGYGLTETQMKYAPLIAAAGNEGVDASAAGLGLCREAAERQADQWVKQQAEVKESIRRWTLEHERRVREGYYSCRDGDGDGVCYER